MLNILGNELRGVAPVSHAYSGGNIVFGTSPGRRGEVLETPAGADPRLQQRARGPGRRAQVQCRRGSSAAGGGARRRVRADPRQPRHREDHHPHGEGVRARCARNPRHGAAAQRGRLRRQLPWRGRRLEPHPHRRRAGRRQAGGNAAQRFGGDLSPTPATSPPPSPAYLAAGGWGTTTSISSGKDLYINFAPAEFANAFDNDARSKAAVMYVEPGGYYEEGLKFKKPVVACVVGRWKAKLTRAVGHAGAMARRRRQRRGQGTLVPEGAEGRWHLHGGKSHRLPGRRGRHQHLADPGGADGGDEAQRHRAGFRARRRSDAQALVRRQSGPAAAAGTRHSAGGADPALQGPDRQPDAGRSAAFSRASR